MLKSLLIPLDGSKFGESSLPLATAVARAAGAKLHLAHVHIPYEPEHLLASTAFQFEGVSIDEYDANHLHQEEDYLAEIARPLSADGGCADAKVLTGSRVAASLAAHAAEVDADMVFISSHGRSGFSRAWLGSVADEMIRTTTLPLVVTRSGDGRGTGNARIRNILVPLDGSELAESGLASAKDLARATQARITLAHIVSVSPLWPRMLLPTEHEVRPGLIGGAEYLNGVAARLQDDGFDVATRVATGGTPALAIVELAEQLNADVIAMATHGYGGVRRTFLGSVADKVVRTSPIPVLVTRPGGEA
jgi:nucleotide-binding universal stress UspA family protein